LFETSNNFLDVRKVVASCRYLIMLCLRFMHTWGRRPFLAPHLQRKEQLEIFFQPAYYYVCECAVGIVPELLIMVTPTHIVLASTVYDVPISVVNVRAVWGSECQF
jgi:hypothetical protein